MIKFITARDALDYFIKEYFYNRDFYKVKQIISQTIQWIGLSKQEVFFRRDDVLNYIKKGIEDSPVSYYYEYDEIVEKPISENVVMFFIDVKKVGAARFDCYLKYRQSYVFKLEKDNVWRLILLNTSIDSLNESVCCSNNEAKRLTIKNRKSQIGDLIDGGMIGSYLKKDYPIWFISNEMLKFLGYLTKEQFSKDNDGKIINSIHIDDRDRVKKSIDNLLQKNKKYSIIYRMKKADGSYAQIFDMSKLLITSNGEKVISSVCLDMKTNKQIFTEYIQNDTLKKELVLAKSSYRAAICNQDLNYFELNLDDKELYTSGYCQQNFNMSKIIENYPYKLNEMGIIHPNDWLKYKNYIEKIYNGEAESAQFEFRILNSIGEYVWIRKNFSVVIDEKSQRKKAIGMVFYVDEEMKNKIKYQTELKRLEKSDKEYIAFLAFDVTSGLVVDHDPKDFPMGRINAGEPIEKLFSEFLPTVNHLDKENVLKNFLSKDFLINAYEKNESPSIKYLRIAQDGKRTIWAESKIHFMKQPYTGDLIAFVNTYDINERENRSILMNTVVDIEFDFIARIDVDNDDVLVISSKNDLLDIGENDCHMNVDKYIKKICKLRYAENYKNNIPTKEEYYEMLKKSFKVKDEFENAYYLADGTRKRVTTKIIHKDKLIYCVACTDITPLTKRDQEMKKKLQDALDAANIANEAKSDFFSKMSHDMRTPLSAILSFSDFGLEEATDKTDKRYFKQINDNSLYLLGLINDILDLQKIESKSYEINNSVGNLHNFKKSIINIVQPRAALKSVYFKCPKDKNDKDNYYVFDQKATKQILINILINAIKYTPTGGHVLWEAYPYTCEDGKKYFRNIILDDGVGMSKEFMQKMYDRFTREKNPLSEKETGSGLGLSIAKNYIDALGGKIFVESTLGVGTKFIIDVPYEFSNKVDYEKEILKNQIVNCEKLEGKHLLVCEDVDINAIIITKLLNGIGIEVTHSENGKIGVEKAKNGKYDAILMDIRMPVMDGLTAAKNIRKFDKNTPIIALSANAYREDVEKSLESGMNAHLSKPIDKNKLFKILCELL